MTRKVEEIKVKPKDRGLKKPRGEVVLGVKREDSLWMRKLAVNNGADKNDKWQQMCFILSQEEEMKAIGRSWVQLKQKRYFLKSIDF